MKTIVSKNGIALIFFCVSIGCFIGAYTYYTKALELKESSSQEENNKFTYVEEKSFYNRYYTTGKIESVKTESYSIDVNDYNLLRNYQVGDEVNKGDKLAKDKSNENDGIIINSSGVVTKISEDENGDILICVDDLENLKAGFYVEQEWSDYFSVGDTVSVEYNGIKYESEITYISPVFSVESADDSDDSVRLYMEATVDKIENAKINANIKVCNDICLKKNVKAVEKSAIKYKGDIPYVISIKGGEKKEIYIELGVSDENMVEIISNEIVIGDEIIVN